jgi:hypothetical protein
MALPIVECLTGFAKTKWWVLFGVLFIATAATIVTVQQTSFSAELRAVAQSNVDYLMLCGFRRGVTYDPCHTIGPGGPGLGAALENLSNATTRLPPGHANAAKEMMLRIGRGSLTSRQYVRCFRVVRFAGAERIYINDITTDPDCTRIEKYRAGYVAIPEGGLGDGAI